MYMYIEIPRDRHKDKFRWASCDVTCMTRIAFTKVHISITTNVLSVKSGMTFCDEWRQKCCRQSAPTKLSRSLKHHKSMQKLSKRFTSSHVVRTYPIKTVITAIAAT